MMQLLGSDTGVPNLAKPEGVMCLLWGSKRPVLPQGFDKRSHTQGFNIALPPWQRREAISSALTPLQGLSYTDYLRQPLPRYAAERLLQLLVDTAVDINAHLIVELTGAPPQDYYDSFIKAAQAGVLSAAFALSIAQSTGLRHRLVHQYEAIDHAIVHSAIAEAITQYTEYCRHITTWLDRHVLPPTA